MILVRILIVAMSAATGLCGEVNVAILVLAGQESSRDPLAARHLSISAVELGLEAAAIA